MRKFLTFFLLLTFFPLLAPPLQAKPQPFFTVDWKNDKAWFTSPSGKPFLSMGVNAIGDQSYRAPNDDYYNPVKNQYDGNKKTWLKGVFTRLRKWHFNTIGCWADEDLLGQKFPHTDMLYIGRGNPWDDVLLSVFTDDFAARAKENAQKAAKYKNDPYLVGYFLDNELPWWGEVGWHADGQETLLQKYALKAVDDANKRALEKFFEDRYDQDIQKFDEAWGLQLQSFDGLDAPVTLSAKTKRQKADAESWVGVVADRYFSVTTQALTAVDPNHLILGVRFAGESPWPAVEACAKYCDVVSVNTYEKSGNINQALLDNFYACSKKPILISEYSFSAMENQSGDPNNHGADVAVPTQKERAGHLDNYARQLLGLPYVVGLHWYEWADESPEGRFDGENCDYGLVDIHDHAYPLITQEHVKLNLIAAPLHLKSVLPLPMEFKENLGPDYRKADAGVKVPAIRNFLKIDNSAHVDTWGDGATGGKAVANTTTGVITLDYETGTGWGCGASIPSNVPPLGNGGTVDLRGYNFFQFKAFVPKDVRFTIYMSESGSAAPGQAQYDGQNGADGESYSFPPFTGTGKWEDYRVDLSELERRTVWGNQHGNNILDLQALEDVEFYLPQSQGSGRMLVKDLQFMVK
jgi:hypothetical protein